MHNKYVTTIFVNYKMLAVYFNYVFIKKYSSTKQFKEFICTFMHHFNYLKKILEYVLRTIITHNFLQNLIYII